MRSDADKFAYIVFNLPRDRLSLGEVCRYRLNQMRENVAISRVFGEVLFDDEARALTMLLCNGVFAHLISSALAIHATFATCRNTSG